MIDVQGLTKEYGRLRAVDNLSFRVEPGQVLGFLGPKRRRQDHDDAHRRRLPAGHLGPRARLRPRHRNAVRRGQTPHRLSARGRAELSRDDAALVPRLHRGGARHASRRNAANGSTRFSRCCILERVLDQSIDTLSKGYQAPRRSRAGDPARSRGADPRRAHRRPRSEPEARGSRADRPHGARQDHRDLDAPARGSRRRVQPRDHHRARQDPGRRHAARSRDAVALPQRGVREARERRAADRSAPRDQRTRRGREHGARREEPAAHGLPGSPASCRSPRSTRWPRGNVGSLAELHLESGRFDEVFRSITGGATA